jgi:hypothetical protein
MWRTDSLWFETAIVPEVRAALVQLEGADVCLATRD